MLFDVRKEATFEEPGKDASLFTASGIASQEEVGTQDRPVCGLYRGDLAPNGLLALFFDRLNVSTSSKLTGEASG